MAKTITVTDADKHFAEIFDRVVEGETYIVTSEENVAIRLERVSQDTLDREAAREQLIARLTNQEGFSFVPWTRNELYDDEDEVQREHLEFLEYLRSLPFRKAEPWTRDELYDDDLGISR